MAWHLHLPRPKAFCQAASQGVGPSAEQGAASHQHLLQRVCSARATGRISRSTPGSKGAAFAQRSTGTLTSRQSMKKTAGHAQPSPLEHAWCRREHRRTGAVGKHAAPARLGYVTQVPQSHQGYKKGPGNTCPLGQ